MEDKVITLIITQNCQLACKYCYCVGKNNFNTMSYDTMEKAILFSTELLILSNYSGNVIFDFIGGEPLLEIDLIYKASEFVEELFKRKSFSNMSYGFRIATNGILYGTDKVQKYIKKFYKKLNVTVSIDGNKKKNDLNRIFPNGKGSYDVIIDNVKLWIAQFPDALTRITLSSPDLPFLFESILSLYFIGLKRFDISVIVENVWKKYDDIILENELVKLADYICEHNLVEDIYISAFENNIGQAQKISDYAKPCGNMNLAIDSNGDIYNCLRFSDFALKKNKSRKLGNIFSEFYPNRMRPLLSMHYDIIYPQQCKECNVATGCKICPADCYDNSSSDTIFERTTYICKMHKAKVRAKNYYWNKILLRQNR